MERLLGLHPSERSPRFWMALSLVWAVALLATVWFFATFDDLLYGWNEVVFLLGFASQFVWSLGEALLVGAFGGRFAERGRALRVVGSLSLALTLFIFGASSGLRMGGVVGAMLGGSVVIALYVFPALFYRQRPGRGQPTLRGANPRESDRSR